MFFKSQNLKRNIFQITIPNLKFKFPANNSNKKFQFQAQDSYLEYCFLEIELHFWVGATAGGNWDAEMYKNQFSI